MDPALAISNAQDVVAKANLSANLQEAAFAEVLRYFLAAGAPAPGSPSAGPGSSSQPASPAGSGWSQVTNTTAPQGPPAAGSASTGAGAGSTSPAPPASPASPGWSQVTNTESEAVPPVS